MFASDDRPVGTELAGYRVERAIGRGGMSVVYLADDLRLKRRVALKVLASDLAEDESFRVRFLEESELAASIDHPNIVPVYEAGEVDGELFIAMRYVDGDDLKRRLRAGSLAPEDAVDILSQVAGALDAAHARGLVHRDVKPSNVLLDRGGGREGRDHVYLADFGLMKRVAAPPGTPADDGRLMGTIDYVAPEQIAGESVDARADVYSLGCLLYECLAGEPPFGRRSDVAVLFAHLEEAPPRLHDRRPELPVAIDAVVAKALAKEPDERQQTCRELVDDAREALGIATPARSRWLRARTVVAVTLLMLVAAGLASYFAVRSGSDQAPPRDSLVRIDPATNEVVESIAVGPEASSVAIGDGYLWVTSYADRTLWRVDPETGASRVTKVSGGTPQDVVVQGGLAVVANGPFEISYERIDAASGELIETIPLPGAEGGAASVAIGPEGIWVAACGYDGGSVARVKGSLLAAENFAPLDRAPIVPSDPGWLFFTTPDSGGYNDVAVGGGAVWLARDGGPVLKRLDPRTREVVATIELPFTAKSLAATDDALWLTAIVDDVVARLDPATNAITMTVPVGRGADGVAVGGGAVWVANAIDGTVSRIDPATGDTIATIDVGAPAEDVVVGAGGVWVTTHTT